MDDTSSTTPLTTYDTSSSKNACPATSVRSKSFPANDSEMTARGTADWNSASPKGLPSTKVKRKRRQKPSFVPIIATL